MSQSCKRDGSSSHVLKNSKVTNKEQNMFKMSHIFATACLTWVVAFGTKFLMDHVNSASSKSLKVHKLSVEEVEFFNSFDMNQDGVIDLEEFTAVVKQFYAAKEFETKSEQYVDSRDYKEIYDPLVDEMLRLQSLMEPVVLSSMSQTNKNPAFGSPVFKPSSEFEGLFLWKASAVPYLDIYAKDFKAFLPPDQKQPIGKPYWIISPPSSTEDLTSFRYTFPNPVTKTEILLHRLLSMFHDRPFITMRFAPQGGIGVIRAENALYLDIYFRFHCEFQLNEPPGKPFWFTPSQFTGHMILSRDASHVRYFHLYVPNENKLNVDMEWETEEGDNNMEVDIGYLPKLEIKQSAPSSPPHLVNEDGSVLDRRELWKNGQDIQLEFDKIVWRSQVSVDSVTSEMEKVFFPFKQVEYLPFADAFARATAEKKLVHQVVLWGALDDQSC